MGINATNLIGWELTAGNGGRPRFIYNIVSAEKRFTPETATAKWTTTGTFSGVDISSSTGPAVYGIDSRASVQTSPGITDVDVYYNIRNPDPVLSPGVEQRFDCMAIINSNFSSSAAYQYLHFEVSSNDSAYQRVRTYTFPGTDINERIWIPRWDRDDVTRAFDSASFVGFYSTDARYFRLHLPLFTGSPSPAFGEVIFGRSVWLKGFPSLRWDDKWEETDANSFEAKSGDVVNYVNYSGRRVRTFNYTTADEDEIEALDRLWKHTGYGSNSFLFDPATDWTTSTKKPAFYRQTEPRWMMPISYGPTGRTWTFEFKEQPPYLAEGDK